MSDALRATKEFEQLKECIVEAYYDAASLEVHPEIYTEEETKEIFKRILENLTTAWELTGESEKSMDDALLLITEKRQWDK